MTLAILMQHPEYHALLDQQDRALNREYLPEMGETNPFLHLAMHLSIAEQYSIDQPQGIRHWVDALTHQSADRHVAEHEVMDCLGEMLWHAGRYQTAPDANIYFQCLRGKVQASHPDAGPMPTPNEE